MRLPDSGAPYNSAKLAARHGLLFARSMYMQWHVNCRCPPRRYLGKRQVGVRSIGCHSPTIQGRPQANRRANRAALWGGQNTQGGIKNLKKRRRASRELYIYMLSLLKCRWSPRLALGARERGECSGAERVVPALRLIEPCSGKVYAVSAGGMLQMQQVLIVFDTLWHSRQR